MILNAYLMAIATTVAAVPVGIWLNRRLPQVPNVSLQLVVVAGFAAFIGSIAYQLS